MNEKTKSYDKNASLATACVKRNAAILVESIDSVTRERLAIVEEQVQVAKFRAEEAARNAQHEFRKAFLLTSK